MKGTLSSYFLTSLTVVTIVAGSIYFGFNESNEIDESGMRQGYWVIKGNMVDDPKYTDSSVIEEGNYENDLKSGVWKKYFPSGKLRSEITFQNNRPIGKYTLYYENGVIEEQGNWQKSKNTGSFKRNYENGNSHQEFFFSDNGKRNGAQVYYHPNGKIALEVTVVNGKENGVMKRYDETGTLTEEKTFNSGSFVKGSTKSYNKQEEKYIPEPAKVEKDSNVEETTNVPKEEEETNAAHHFQPNGHNILYDKNKNVTQTGDFRNGRLWNGKWYKYNKEGILLRVDVYRNGKFIGHGLIEEQ